MSGLGVTAQTLNVPKSLSCIINERKKLLLHHDDKVVSVK